MTNHLSAAGDHLHFELDCSEPLSAALIARLAACCDQAEDADAPAMLVLRLRGQRGAGGDLAAAGAPDMGLARHWERLLCRLEKLPVMTVALAEGHCHGLLLDLLLASDHRCAGAGSRFSLAASGAAIWPGMSLHRLTAQLGVSRARPLVLFGAAVSAAEALALGLVSVLESTPSPAPGPVPAWLGEAALRDLPLRRRLLLESAGSSYDDALGGHLAACDRTLRWSAAQAQRHAESLLQSA